MKYLLTIVYVLCVVFSCGAKPAGGNPQVSQCAGGQKPPASSCPGHPKDKKNKKGGKPEEEGDEAIAQASLVIYDYYYRLSCSNKYSRKIPPTFIIK